MDDYSYIVGAKLNADRQRPERQQQTDRTYLLAAEQPWSEAPVRHEQSSPRLAIEQWRLRSTKYALGIGFSVLINIALLAGLQWAGHVEHRAPAGEVHITELAAAEPAPQMKYVRLLSDRRV